MYQRINSYIVGCKCLQPDRAAFAAMRINSYIVGCKLFYQSMNTSNE